MLPSVNLDDNQIIIDVLNRLKNGMKVDTWKEMAIELGVNPNQISQIKSQAEGKLTQGKQRKLPLKEILTWALQNNVSMHWLFFGEEPEDAQIEISQTPDKTTKVAPTDEKAEQLMRILLKARELHYEESGKPTDPLPAGGIEMNSNETLFLELLILDEQLDDDRRAWLRSELQTLIFKTQDKLAELKR